MTAATLLEAHAELHGRRRSFAVQELLDCVPNPLRCGGQGGCQDATVELAMSYAMHLGLAEAAAPRPPMSEDQEMPLLLKPGGLFESISTRFLVFHGCRMLILR